MNDSTRTSAPDSRTFSSTDLIGYSVHATDGVIGTVDAHSEEVAPDHLVVDTGGPLLSKKVVLPCRLVELVDVRARALHVVRTKELIKAAPRFDRDMRVTDPGYRARIDDHYRRTAAR